MNRSERAREVSKHLKSKHSNSITLSKKHGVNPTLGMCFVCGGDTSEIGLLGRVPQDAEAPRQMVLSYEPCDKCQERLKTHFLLVECSHNCADDRPPFTTDDNEEPVYPTGRTAWAKLNFIKFLLHREDVDETQRIMALDPHVFKLCQKAMDIVEHSEGENGVALEWYENENGDPDVREAILTNKTKNAGNEEKVKDDENERD